MTRILAIAFGILCGIFFAADSRGQSAETPEAIFASYGLAAFPKMTFLCQRRVYPSPGTTRLPDGKHITWSGFASAAPTSELVAFYKKSLGTQGFATEGAASTWRIPSTSAQAERILSIHPYEADTPAANCPVKNPNQSGSVLILSSY